MQQFFIGLHHPSTAWPFLHSMISLNNLRDRKRAFNVNCWVLDSGGYTELSAYGKWRMEPQQYADQINQLKQNGILLAAVSQDFMCTPQILAKTGFNIHDHQTMTIERYVELLPLTDVFVMPVIQGDTPDSYAAHVQQYGYLLPPGAWVGVGSICHKSGNPSHIEDILIAIHSERPDLRLHGFGLKFNCLRRGTIRQLLKSSDSAAWSYAARKIGDGSEHDPRRALAYAAKIEPLIDTPAFVQQQLFRWWA